MKATIYLDLEVKQSSENVIVNAIILGNNKGGFYETL